jgi:hypothetical protein
MDARNLAHSVTMRATSARCSTVSVLASFPNKDATKPRKPSPTTTNKNGEPAPLSHHRFPAFLQAILASH